MSLHHTTAWANCYWTPFLKHTEYKKYILAGLPLQLLLSFTYYKFNFDKLKLIEIDTIWEKSVTWRKLIILMTRMFTDIPNPVFNISALAFSLWDGNLALYLWFMVLKKLRKSFQVTCCFGDVIKPRPYRIYCQDTQWTRKNQKSIFSVQATSCNCWNIHIPNWANALHWRRQNKFSVWKNKIASQSAK